MIEITGIEHKNNSRESFDIRRLDESSIKLLYKDEEFTVIELNDNTIIYVEESIKTLDARISLLANQEISE